MIHPDAWIAPGAVVVGDVEIGEGSSVWYGAVLRGDINKIRVGARSNIQDQCVIHVTRDEFSVSIGDEVTVGHRAVIHGSTVENGALVGIGAVVLDGARVGEGAWIAAGALVPPGMSIEPETLVVGVPARAVRRLSREELERQRKLTLLYVSTAKSHSMGASLTDS
ncbi:gamma carbonic anhydrase family protein [Myxococcota bacterium]|nr:gamma carbonic anhydrase family protein [Myxococcota bacterium]